MVALRMLHLLPRKEKTKIGICFGRPSNPNKGQKRIARLSAASGQGSRASAASGQGVAEEGMEASGQVSPEEGSEASEKRRRSWKKFFVHKFQRSRANTALKQLRAQALSMNRRGAARTGDHLMVVNKTLTARTEILKPLRVRRGGTKTGKWKVHTPEAMCKAAFGNLNGSFKAKAVDGSSKSHAMKCTWTVAKIIHSAGEKVAVGLKRPLAQLEASGPVADGVVDDFHINNNMFDESQLWLRDSQGGKRRRRVLAAGCQVTRRKPGGNTLDIDIIRPPCPMECYTAATCASILAKPDDPTGLLPTGASAPKAKYFASITATDSHSVNKLLSKWISKEQASGQGETNFHVAMYCTQHKTGNAVQQVTEYLGLIRPGFALAACLQAGDIAKDLDDDLEAVLEQQLEIVDPATAALDAPDDTRAFLRELLEQCHVGPPASVHVGPLASERSSRAKEADEIVPFFAASGQGKRLRHVCPAGCCANRAESIKKAHMLVRRLVVPCISEPAANKYTKVDPVMRKLAIACNFVGLLRRAFARKFKENGDSESDISSDAALGAPRDANRHWRKVKHIKLNRSYNFLKQRASEYLPLIWLCVCSCIMVVHYKLFKHGTWFSHRADKDRCNIFDFCTASGQGSAFGPGSDNPICEALSTLASMLLDPEGTGKRPLALLFLKFGERYLEWPRHVREFQQGSLCIAFHL